MKINSNKRNTENSRVKVQIREIAECTHILSGFKLKALIEFV